MVILKNQEKKLQKNRFTRNPKKPKISLGDAGLITKNEGRLEFVQLSSIKKIVKKFISKKKSEIDLIREKIWYLGVPNFILQKKSKNSRMGKGKGMIERKVIRIRRGVVLFEFKGVSPLKLQKLVKKINKILSVKFTYIFSYNRSYCVWSNKEKYNYYFAKYLYN